MWQIKTVDDDKAEGALREMYDQDLKDYGYVWNTSRIWSQRPEIGAQWKTVQKAIRATMRLRDYELVTIAAARAQDCVYCMLAHGDILTKNGFSPQQVIAILKDYHAAGLTPKEVHMMDYSDRISRDAATIGKKETEPLRRDGLNDKQITDIALTAVMRNFMSRFFHALGAEPDPELIKRQPEIWEYLRKRERGEATGMQMPRSVE